MNTEDTKEREVSLTVQFKDGAGGTVATMVANGQLLEKTERRYYRVLSQAERESEGAAMIKRFATICGMQAVKPPREIRHTKEQGRNLKRLAKEKAAADRRVETERLARDRAAEQLKAQQ